VCPGGFRTFGECHLKHAVILSQVMTPNPVTISPESRAIDALRTMNELGFRHLPVVQSGKLVGIITRSAFQGMEIDQLDTEVHLWECIR
jgi:predicted transcriptional regulator